MGVAFLGSVLVNELFSVGPAFERMSDGFRPAMQPAPIAALEQDLAGMEAVTEEFGSTAVPMLSGALQMTPDGFIAFMGQQFPDVATGIDQLPAIVESFRGVVGTLEAGQDRFASADAIPNSSLPATTIPWGMLAAGIVLLLVGVVVILRPGRVAPVIVLVVGALLVAGPLALSLPRKASDADTMNGNLEPVYTAEMLGGAGDALGVVGAMGTQMQEEMLPALGAQLGMDEAQLQAFLGENLPAMAGALRSMPEAMGRFQGVVQLFEAHLGDYDTLKPVAFVPIVWTLIIGGIVALLGGAWALATRRPAETTEAPQQDVRRAMAA